MPEYYPRRTPRLQVAMVEGNRENIKITTPFDIKVAEALLG